MKSDFLIAITQLSAEKNLPKEVVLGAVEAALVSAYRKDAFAPEQNIRVKINQSNGSVTVWAEKVVVEKVADPRAEISLDRARQVKADAKIGDAVEVEDTPHNAGRIAAQTAKQVIIQRLHEAEHSAIFQEYVGKEGDIVTGVVQRIEAKQVLLDLGRVEAVMPPSEQVPTERYRVGQRTKVYLVEVSKAARGPRIVVSRSHPELVKRLFESEVPEVYNGIVEIKGIAREAGYRSKVAVAAKQEGIDAVGCCVGLRGIRIQNIVNELAGEKIDVILWSADPAQYVASALSPAQVLGVRINPTDGSATAIVPDRQLSLAIGKEGQNVRLAAKLTGCKIDIKSATEAEAELAKVQAEAAVRAAAVRAAQEAAAAAAAPAVEAVAEPVPEPVLAEAEAVGAAAEAEAEEAEEEAEPVEVAALAPPVPVEAGKPLLRFAEDLMVPRADKAEPKKKKKKAKESPDDALKGKKRRTREFYEDEDIGEF